MNGPKTVMACLFTLAVLFAVSSYAEEQRCNELGANCICSEPFNTATIVRLTSWWNPGDTNSKPCNGEDSLLGNVITGSITMTMANTPAVLAKLPAGHSVTRFVRAHDGHAGGLSLGHNSSSIPTKRVAFRWYVYHSATSNGDPANFKWSDNDLGGSCGNSKFFHAGDISNEVVNSGFFNDGSTDFVSSYTIYDWKYNGGKSTTGVTAAWRTPPKDLRGNWYRYELVLVNRNGGASPNGLRMYLYMKNVTTNGPEVTFWDTTRDFKTASANNDLTPAHNIYRIAVNAFRNGNCPGYQGFSHLMLAGWNTDDGQRIGAAKEVEGGAGAPAGGAGLSAPTGPSNLVIH